MCQTIIIIIIIIITIIIIIIIIIIINVINIIITIIVINNLLQVDKKRKNLQKIITLQVAISYLLIKVQYHI